MRSCSTFGDVEPALDPLDLIAKSIEPRLKMGALLHIVSTIANEPTEFSLDAGEPSTVFDLRLFHALHALIDPTQIDENQILGFLAHSL